MNYTYRFVRVLIVSCISLIQDFVCFCTAFRFVVREKYPSDRGKERPEPPSAVVLMEVFNNAKPDELIKKILNPILSKFLLKNFPRIPLS